MHPVLPGVLAACSSERAAPGGPLRLCQGRPPLRLNPDSDAAADLRPHRVVLAPLSGNTSGVAVRESRAGRTHIHGVRSGLACRRVTDDA